MSEYERGRRDGVKQTVDYLNEIGAVHFAKHIEELLAATSGTPAPLEPPVCKCGHSYYCHLTETTNACFVGTCPCEHYERAAPPPADETLPVGAPLTECPIWECSEVGPHKHGDGIYARTYTRAAQPSGAQGEGLRELVVKWRKDAEYCLKESDRFADMQEDKRSERWLTQGRTKQACAEELEAALAAAREPAAPASGTEGRSK